MDGWDGRRDAARDGRSAADAWNQRSAWDEQEAPPAPPHGQPPRYPPDNNSAWPGDPYRTNATDEQNVNPPWESESMRYPVPPAAEPSGPAPNWEWGGVESTYPGLSMDDMTGTGKVPVIPLQSTDSAWSGGVRAPRRPPTEKVPAASVGTIVASAGAAVADGAEVDEQPSSTMRALRAGNLVRATAIVSGALLLSRVLGLVRTTLFAATFGISTDANAFTNAFVFPELIFNIVAGGALASAFIPVFTGYLIEKKDRRTAWHIASAALNLSIAALTILAIVGFIFTPQILNIILHPLFTDPDQTIQADLVINLTRVMLLQPIFLGGATVAVAILQARQSFVLPAIAQVLYTASLIFGILLTIADRRWGIFGGNLGIYGPALGVVLGAFLQLVIQIPGLRREKMRYRPTFDVFHPGVRQMFRLMVPRLLNAAMLYVSVIVNRSLLNVISAPDGSDGKVYGYVTAFTLVMLPIGVFGMAVSQASFPTMAAFVAAGEWQRLRDTIMRTLRGVTYLALPSALGLIVLAQPLTQFLLGHGRVELDKIYAIWQPLIFFSIGLLGLSLVEILVRSFYALHDTRTAVEVSILQFMFVIGLSVLLLEPMGANGLALATALGSTGEALVLLLLLGPRVGGLDLRAYGGFFLNALGASVVAALAALAIYLAGGLILPVSTTEASLTTTLNLGIRLSAAALAAVGAFYASARFLGIADTVPLDRIIRRVLGRR
ncbi:MAG TPA: murein biosynthesis integral membrane protein MurJ [Ktedonobacterales bacterium]|jgi:putative peptidoglycan lipid II flippase